MNKDNIVGIDYLRVFLAVLITILHLKPTLTFSEDCTFYITNAITRVGVPGFFFITGFLYSIKKMDLGCREIAVRHIKRMLILYCTWTLVCAPIIIIDFIENPKYFGMSVWFKTAIFIRRFILIGSYTPLWFFLAGIYATGMIYVLKRFHMTKNRILIILGAFTFAGAIFNDCYTPIGALFLGSYTTLSSTMEQLHLYIGTIWKEAIWGAFYMQLGYCMQNKISESEVSKRKLLALIGGVILLLCEVGFLKYLGASEFSKMLTIAPVVILLTTIFVKYGAFWKPKKTLRKISVLIYGFHIVTSFFLNENMFQNSIIRYGANIGVTLLLSFIIIKVSDKIKFLKALY